jgi:hypothetical protein
MPAIRTFKLQFEAKSVSYCALLFISQIDLCDCMRSLMFKQIWILFHHIITNLY